MRKLSLRTIFNALDGITTKISGIDTVIAVGRGGIIPAVLVAERLGTGFLSCLVNFRDDSNAPVRDTPIVIHRPELPPGTDKVLIVDDVSVTGSTLEAVKRSLKDVKTETLVLVGQADHVALPDIRTCVEWPWAT